MPEATVAKSTYYKVSAALMVLLVLTVAVSYVPLGTFSLAVALAIALFKAALIALIFMHVHYSSSLTKLFAAAGVFMFIILIGLTLTDYVTRNGGL